MSVGKRHLAICIVALIAVLAGELVLSVRQESPTFDEPAHLYAGYCYWTTGDFGVNPEHPPLAKLVAALPLLPLDLRQVRPPDMFFRVASAIGGLQFLYGSRNPDRLLFLARLGVSVFTLILALLVVAAAYEMFGELSALIALVLLVFEPNVLAHGALITTDAAEACCLFAATFAFYRYVKRPSTLRLALCGVAEGLALAAKFSGVLLFPILAALALYEIARQTERRSRYAFRMAGALVAIVVIAIGVLWAFYGFRYAARPESMQIRPATAEYLRELQRPAESRVIGFMEAHRLLPEAYLYGLTDIAILSQQGRMTFLLGRLYPEGRWFYFPAALLVKCTLGFLVLVVLSAFARRRSEVRREVVFLVVPAVIFFLAAMSSKADLGLRHILPIFPFLIVLTAASAASIAGKSRRWAYVVAALLIFHVASSLHALPNYLPYSNEVWGGPSKTYKWLADSNVGWGGGLTGVRRYLESHDITDCWFAYSALVNPRDYGIQCRPLPTFFSMLSNQQPVPLTIRGPVLISSEELTGLGWGPGAMNPYAQFATVRPSEVVQGEVIVFDGTFNVRRISALSHYVVANNLLRQGRPDLAFKEANASIALDPDFRFAHELLAQLYAAHGRPDEALRQYQIAVRLYRAIEPAYAKDQPPPQNPLGR